MEGAHVDFGCFLFVTQKNYRNNLIKSKPNKGLRSVIGHIDYYYKIITLQREDLTVGYSIDSHLPYFFTFWV